MIFTIAFVAFLIWGTRRTRNKAVENGKTKELEKNKARIAIFLYPIVGLVISGMVAVKWQSIPSGNEPIVIFYLALAIAAILFGVYKWFQSSNEK